MILSFPAFQFNVEGEIHMAASPPFAISALGPKLHCHLSQMIYFQEFSIAAFVRSKQTQAGNSCFFTQRRPFPNFSIAPKQCSFWMQAILVLKCLMKGNVVFPEIPVPQKTGNVNLLEAHSL